MLQRDVMKMALKEEGRISKEAERIVKWARQTSARLMMMIMSLEMIIDVL